LHGVTFQNAVGHLMTELYETLGSQSAVQLVLLSAYGDPDSAHCDTCLAVTLSRSQWHCIG
jgi:hypothetical protein